jgi:hypothetical protein
MEIKNILLVAAFGAVKSWANAHALYWLLISFYSVNLLVSFISTDVNSTTYREILKPLDIVMLWYKTVSKICPKAFGLYIYTKMWNMRFLCSCSFRTR